jgi:hypothetical protein
MESRVATEDSTSIFQGFAIIWSFFCELMGAGAAEKGHGAYPYRYFNNAVWSLLHDSST